MSQKEVSHEMIAELVDGELDKADIARVKQAILSDPSARETYQALLHAKQLFAIALDELKDDSVTLELESLIREHPIAKKSDRWKIPMSMAASTILGAGLTMFVLQSNERNIQTLMISDVNNEIQELRAYESDLRHLTLSQTELLTYRTDSQTSSLDDSQKIKLAMDIASWPFTDAENKRLPDASKIYVKAIVLLILGVDPKPSDLLRSDSARLEEAGKLLSEAASLGHRSAAITLAEFADNQQALAKYREILQEIN